MKRIPSIAVLFFCCYFLKAQTAAPIFYSPNGSIAFKVSVQNNKLFYTVEFNKKTVIENAAMGLVINGYTFGENLSITTVQQKKVNESYGYRGVHSKATNKYNEGIISMKAEFPFKVDIKVFDDGAAFCYVANSKGAANVEKDITEFILPANSIIWSQPNIKYYEGRYSKKLIDTVKQGELMGPPVTIELPQDAGYAAITEGGLTDFAGMSLIANGHRKLVANLSGNVHLPATLQSPWRIIEIGKDLNTLVNCDIIANVSPAYDKKLFSHGYQTDWLKPGRSVWSWLAKTRSVTLENMKHFTDLAAQLGFEYNLVDEGWGNWKDSANHKDNWDMMKELVDYSAAKGVKIWVWKAYPDRGGIPGIKDPAQRQLFFKRCKDLGIAGLKVDFFDSESQEIIQFYQAALHDAAAYHLMMDFHGANKPTGETRTWPNEMSREAIRGMENRPPWAPFNTILPFTRYLAGHADYTPVNFGDRMGEVSWAHHVASMVIFTSPFLCLGVDPQDVLNNTCKEMMQSVPTDWDETIVLPQSKIGELVVYARRKKDTWFIAAMSSKNSVYSFSLRLPFLNRGNYALTTIKDDATKQNNAVLERTTVNAASSINISLNAAGGFVGRFEKLK